jgi:hypothetical protein
VATWRLLFGAVAVAAFLVAIMPTTIREIPVQAASAKWPMATATVTQSDVGRKKTGLLFRYRYPAGGRTYEASERRIVGMTGYYLLENKADFVAKHPIGSTLVIWYNPADPWVATIAPGLSVWDVAAPGAFFIGLAISTGIALLKVWARIKSRVGSKSEQTPDRHL